jgi:hypothetical protein
MDTAASLFRPQPKPLTALLSANRPECNTCPGPPPPSSLSVFFLCGPSHKQKNLKVWCECDNLVVFVHTFIELLSYNKFIHQLFVEVSLQSCPWRYLRQASSHSWATPNPQIKQETQSCPKVFFPKSIHSIFCKIRFFWCHHFPKIYTALFSYRSDLWKKKNRD